jgi:hypothetical protein
MHGEWRLGGKFITKVIGCNMNLMTPRGQGFRHAEDPGRSAASQGKGAGSGQKNSVVHHFCKQTIWRMSAHHFDASKLA